MLALIQLIWLIGFMFTTGVIISTAFPITPTIKGIAWLVVLWLFAIPFWPAYLGAVWAED